MDTMSRDVQLVLLCEDSQHEAFARKFLRGMGWDQRKFRVEKAPKGDGSGEQFVRLRYPEELSGLRQNSNRVKRSMLVMIDGDRFGYQERIRSLDAECEKEKVTARAKDDSVAVFVPTWNIETWLAYLGGEKVDETRSNYPRLERAGDCKEQVQALVKMFKSGEFDSPCPSSLEMAFMEYSRLSHD
jgi:hypothetical protein